jgi:hypothetical protein
MRCNDDGSTGCAALLWSNDTCAMGSCWVPLRFNQQAARVTHRGYAGPDAPAHFRSATLSFWLVEWMLGFITAFACGTVAYDLAVLGWTANELGSQQAMASCAV